MTSADTRLMHGSPMERPRRRAAILVAVVAALAQVGPAASAAGELRVWAVADAHTSSDVKHGRESLAMPIRQAAGLVPGAPPFEWDIMIDAGDLAAGKHPPGDSEGQEVVHQYRALTKHYREDVYQVAGNHDGNYYDHGPGAWFQKWIDPLGQHTRTSEVHAQRRRFPVVGTWERYRFQAGNVLFLMLSDYNSAPTPVGRGHSSQKLKGGFPAGAVRHETFDWWKRQVLENQDKIIVTMHHHVLRDTTTRSRYEGGRGFHGDSGGGEGSGYLYFIVEDPDPQRFDFTPDAYVFEAFLNAFQKQHRRPAIDIWLGGHSHPKHPEQVHDGQGLTETRWGVTFIQCGALTREYGGGTPMSRLLTFAEGRDSVNLRLYIHDRPARGVNEQAQELGWYPKAGRQITLRHPFQAPPDDTRAPPPSYGYVPVSERIRLPRRFGPPAIGLVVPQEGPLRLTDQAVWKRASSEETGECSFDGHTQVDFGPVPMNEWAELTVAARIRTQKRTGIMRVVSKDALGSTGTFVLLFNRRGWSFRVKDRKIGKWVQASWKSTAINDGSWHHVAGLADTARGRVALFVDGSERAAVAWSGGLDDSRKDHLVVGADSSPAMTGQAFSGTISDVRVFRQALGAAAMASLARESLEE